MDYLNVVYSSDDGYVQHLAVSMISLLEHNKDIDEIHFFILDNNISKENKNELKNITDIYRRTIKFISIVQVICGINLNTDFSISAYARLFLSSIIKQDRVLYLDCDTIVVNSLKQLLEIDMKNYYVAGVQDSVSLELRSAVNFSDNQRYINSGVLYINLKKWREDNIEKLFKKCISHHNGNVPHHDQGIINSVCQNNIYILDLRYNLYDTALYYRANELKSLFDLPVYYTQEQIEKSRLNPIIIHYTPACYNRPWFYKCNHPYKEDYLYYLNMTKWKGHIIHEKNEVTRASRRTIKNIIYNILPFNVYCYFLKKKRK